MPLASAYMLFDIRVIRVFEVDSSEAFDGFCLPSLRKCGISMIRFE
jgi:hypothetical protein